MSRMITLTTDFGLEDWFVGAMKGVIASIAPRAMVSDLCHGVPAGDIRAGALAVAAACWCYPEGTVHVVVVDPGVGSDRAALAAEAGGHWFVAPDNGVLTLALGAHGTVRVRRLENSRWFRASVSRTFHGRDIFAPVAAHLARGVKPAQLGPLVRDWVRMEWPVPVRGGGVVRGEVVYVDRFGNAITNIPNGWLTNGKEDPSAECARRRRIPVKTCYAAVPMGSAVSVPGSTGWLEVAVNGGSAADVLGLKPGSRVKVRVG